MKTRNLFKVLLLCTGALSFAQTVTQNFTVETIYKEGRNPMGVYTPNAGDFVTVTYYDGMGRPIQQIQKNASPVDNQNIATHIEYEKNIGQTKNYLSFTTNGNNTDFISDAKQATLDYYYDNPSFGNEYVTNPYTENKYETAPNARILEIGAPGRLWDINLLPDLITQDGRNTIRYQYSFNIADEVKKFEVTSTWNVNREVYTNTIAPSGYYQANSLKKTVTKNENWKASDGKNNTTEEFKATDGKILLKRTYNNNVVHDTYYVYDFYGNLAYVLPPLANGVVTTKNLNDLCYQYLYDEKNRLVEKKLPQKSWEFIVYDKADRIVMTGPVNNPFNTSAAAGWIVTKYDNLGRTLYSGFYSGHEVSSTNRKAIKAIIYAQTNNNENKSTANNTIDGVSTRYTNTKFPTTFKLLTVNYYDNYEFPGAPSSFPSVQGVTPAQTVKGLATGSWTRVITTPSEQKADMSYTLYNNKYQLLRTYTANYLGGYIQNDNSLTFRGIPTKTITTQKKDAAASLLTITNNYTYDNKERLKTHTQQLNGGTAEVIVENVYNDLGVVITKKVGGTTDTPLQKVDYKYNIRGWLTDINNADYYHTDTENDLFQLKINYTQGVANVPPLFNGNISSIFSRTKTDNYFRGYAYKYDHLNRLIEAKDLYYQFGGWSMKVKSTDFYDEALTYDKNGNILSVYRTTKIDNQKVAIDDLTYTYSANQLRTVTDATNSPDGFNDGNKTGVDYTYDTFGNLKTDKNKGITDIKYNHLNQPVEITFSTGKISYTYDATGTKVKKVIQPNSGMAQTTDYLYGFQYLNGQLQFFPHAEGYVKPNGTNSYLYVYQYKDHLGNVRLSYADCDGNGIINPATEILEENNYYPFGLKHQGYNDIANSCRSEEAEAYKYNSKEYEDSFALNMYEYGARNYDPALGRFFNIDNYAEKFSDMTPYQYAANNPVVFVDVNGDYIYIHDRDTGIDYKYSYGKLYSKVEGVWKEHTPEAGSHLEFVLTALNNIYDMTSDSSGGDGGAGSWLLGMFENNTINTYIYKGSKYEMSHSYGDITAGFFEKTLGEFMTNQGFSPIDFHIALAHELAHALSFNLINSSIREQVWYNRPNSEHSVKIDEIFATMIENNIRAEQNVPLRTHYQDKGTFENNPTLFEKSRILDQNNQPTIEAMQHLNKYKESGLWKN